MKKLLENFFSSGWEFTSSELDLRSKIQMINISLLLSAFGLMFGIISNIAHDNSELLLIELIILSINLAIFFILRKKRELTDSIANYITAQYTVFFIFLIYISEPESLRHVWLFTFPLVVLFFQGTKKSIYWLLCIVFFLLIAPFQPFVDVTYTVFQILYVSVVFIITVTVVYFYQYKMDEVKELILKQQRMLESFNGELENQVSEKTSELKELNESLEVKVEEKLQEIIKRDRILEAQSKQAVMGEMISMIAHQWRQPLSTITLQISQLQVQKMLGEEIEDGKIDKVLSQISDNVIYLSDTIDDFLTYFSPDKDADAIDLHSLLQKVVSLAMPRAKKYGVEIILDASDEIEVLTYINEFVQVVLNIVNNAIDALADSGKRELRVKILTQSIDSDIIVNIIDNANGIPKENLTHLFEPYFSTKGKNGTGLGLYMSQMIVQKQLNGTIDVKSSSNGSIFTIKIPRSVE